MKLWLAVTVGAVVGFSLVGAAISTDGRRGPDPVPTLRPDFVISASEPWPDFDPSVPGGVASEVDSLLRRQEWYGPPWTLGKATLARELQSLTRLPVFRTRSTTFIEAVSRMAWYSDGLSSEEAFLLYTAYQFSRNSEPLVGGPIDQDEIRAEVVEALSRRSFAFVHFKNSGLNAILVTGGDRATAIRVMPEIERAAFYLDRLIGGPLPWLVWVRLVHPEVMAEAGAAGLARGNQVWLSSDIVNRGLIAHEFVHLFVPVQGLTWFDEGLAHFFQFYITRATERRDWPGQSAFGLRSDAADCVVREAEARTAGFFFFEQVYREIGLGIVTDAARRGRSLGLSWTAAGLAHVQPTTASAIAFLGTLPRSGDERLKLEAAIERWIAPLREEC